MSQQRSEHPKPNFHHIAIQTNDLKNSVSWYEAFLGCQVRWSLTTFSELTNDRLPGIRRLVEMVTGDVRIHLFERSGRPAPGPAESVTGIQHFCLSAADPEDLVTLRERWIGLFDSGKYSFALAAKPTEIVTDGDGVQSFYAYDVNGLEFEFTYLPSEHLAATEACAAGKAVSST